MVEKIEKNVLTAWERVEIARNPKRKTALDYINEIFDEFIELHGDRCYGDDKAMVCGLGRIENQNYTTEKELFKNITDKIKQEIQTTVQELKSKTKDEIVEERYQKFRKISGFKEV